VLQRSAGTHDTREIRTGDLLAGLAGALPAAGAALVGGAPPALPVASVPPAPVAAAAAAASVSRDAASAANIAASRVDRLWARVFANVLLRA
jgi:NAD(P)H-hydrate repair Nnr-like enzyme with NAD(P)H-hydrate dehydratase domain